MSLKTRIYALRVIDELLQVTDLATFKSRDVTSFANMVIPFLFKGASSPFEEIKDIGLKIFINVFKVIYKKLSIGITTQQIGSAISFLVSSS